MLFNSYAFVLLFLPTVLLTYVLLERVLGQHRLTLLWLVLASFVFYGYWSPRYVLLLAGSSLVNFRLGRWIAQGRRTGKRLCRPVAGMRPIGIEEAAVRPRENAPGCRLASVGSARG
jgi:hypothetical protein